MENIVSSTQTTNLLSLFLRRSSCIAHPDLSSDVQIRVIGRMESEICTKMFKTWNEKLSPIFAATTPGCSMVKVARLDDAFSEVFESQASPVEGQSLQQKGTNRR